MKIRPYLEVMVKENASDLFFSSGAPVGIKVEGETRQLGARTQDAESIKQLADGVMNEEQRRAFEANLEMNLALQVTGVGRFRVNIFRQRGDVGMVVRHIKDIVPSLEQLHLPARLGEIIMESRGLVLLVGSTGCGKSTTLASMIEHRNQRQSGHILTVEEPIEYVHTHKRSIVDQREIGIDTLSYANALKNAMREAPDVILIGEIRDADTMRAAISYAETGHLCLSTLHANNVNQAFERILNFFPDSSHKQFLMDLSMNLRAIISQRLVIGIDGRRLPAVEILLSSPFVADLILKGEIPGIRDAMEQSGEYGMRTFDQHLFEMYSEGKISLEDAINNADSRNNLALRIRLEHGVETHELDDVTISKTL